MKKRVVVIILLAVCSVISNLQLTNVSAYSAKITNEVDDTTVRALLFQGLSLG